MTIDTEKNNKNEAVKGFLANLLKEFELDEEITLRTKKKLEQRNNLHQQTQKLFRLGLIESGVNTIKNIRFESVDHLASVRRLKEAELFFSKPYYLERFKFLQDSKFSYCISQVPQEFLTYADIETQLDVFDKKALGLFINGHQLAGREVQWLVSNLRNLNQWYFEEKRIDYAYYRSKAFAIINEARPILDQHPGYKELLGNLILLILVIPCIVNKAINNHYLFFQKPNCSEQLNQLN